MDRNVLLIAVYSDQEIARFNATVLEKVTDIGLSTNIDVNKKPVSIWGITSSGRNSEIWNRMKINDHVVFQVGTDRYYIGLVSHKLKSKQIANELWKKYHLYASSFNHLFFITRLSFVSQIPKALFLSNTEQTMDSISLLYEGQIVDRNFRKFLADFDKAVNTKASQVIDKLKAIDYSDPPQRVKAQVTRIIRDTTKSFQLKVKYNFACQICGYQLKVNSIYYSEVHHIWPLGEGGLDNFDNMIVLCPNHHAEFDLCAIAIDPKDGMTIIDSNHNVRGKATFLRVHKLSASNLKYHYKKITQKQNEFD